MMPPRKLKFHAKGKEFVEHHLTYRFNSDGRKWVFGDALLTKAQYDQLLDEEILEVTYDPEDPTKNMVEAYMYLDFGPWLSLLLFVSLGIGTFTVLREQARQNGYCAMVMWWTEPSSRPLLEAPLGIVQTPLSTFAWSTAIMAGNMWN